MGRANWLPGLAAVLLLAAAAIGISGPGIPGLGAAELDDESRRGLALYEQGRYEAALPHLEKAVELARTQWGPGDPRLAVELNNLGEAYRRAGRIEAAEQAFRQAVAIDQATAPESIGMATGLNNLALVLRGRGRLDEAETLYRRALGILERELGPYHPDVARALNNLASVYMLRGEPGRALPIQERAVASATGSLGAGNGVTRQLAANLAAIRDAASRKADRPAAPPPLPAPVNGRLPPPPSALQPARPATGGFGLHLASVRDRKAVEPEWRRFQKLFPDLEGLPPHEPVPVEVEGKGTYWRVIGGRLPDRATAEALCRRLKAKEQYCRVVGP